MVLQWRKGLFEKINAPLHMCDGTLKIVLVF